MESELAKLAIAVYKVNANNNEGLSQTCYAVTKHFHSKADDR